MEVYENARPYMLEQRRRHLRSLYSLLVCSATTEGRCTLKTVHLVAVASCFKGIRTMLHATQRDMGI